MNKKHSSCSFQDELLSDDRFRAWVGKTGNKKEACCVVSKRNIDISAMGSSALHSHVSGKKYKELMTAHSTCGSINLFFNKPCSSGTTKAQHKTGTVNEMLTKNDVTNAEIMWCLKVVDGHFSCNSCSDLANLFQCVFTNSKIAHQFSLGKTKCRYMILYAIVPYCRSELLKQINSFLFFSLSFDECLNSMLQKCQMEVNIQF